MKQASKRLRAAIDVAVGLAVLLVSSGTDAKPLPLWTVAIDALSQGAVFNRSGRDVDYAFAPTLELLIDPLRSGTWRTGLAAGPQIGESWKAVVGWHNSFALWGILDARVRAEIEPGVAIVGPGGKVGFSARAGILADLSGLLRIGISSAYETRTNEVTVLTYLGTDIMALIRASKPPCTTPGC